METSVASTKEIIYLGPMLVYRKFLTNTDDMKRQILKSFLCLFLMGSCDSCLYMDSEVTLKIANQSEQDVYVLLGGIWTTADTLLPDIKTTARLKSIAKDVTRDVGMEGTTWKKKFKEFGIDTMRIFILSADTVAKYKWEVIQKDYNILQRYDVSYKDLDKRHEPLYYPPTDAMKNIRMWPPYDK